MGVVSDLLLLALLVIVVIVFYPKIISLLQLARDMLSNYNIGGNFNFPNSTPAHPRPKAGPLVNYTLSLINKDRNAYGLGNVTLSPTESAQQHADSMLQNGYFSHWDIYGMKPYMRYTLVGGLGAMQENIAYTQSGVSACLGSLCKTYGNVNVSNAIASMEYSMMYNDSICCNNGHRDNILDSNHNQVSVGIAYNSTTVYLVEDFVNNYITWLNDTPGITKSDEVYLEGRIASGYNLSTIEINYDAPVQNMTVSQLDGTSDYSYGPAIAGIARSPLYHYQSVQTIVADSYYTKGSDFFVAFNMSKLIEGNGAGEYTVSAWLNQTGQSQGFIGSSYTIFVNGNGTVYVPNNV